MKKIRSYFSGPAEGSENFHHDLRGVIPRSFEYLFNHINRQREIVCGNSDCL